MSSVNEIKSTKAKTIIKILYGTFAVVYMAFVFPNQLSKLLDYHEISQDYFNLSQEVYAISDDFLSAADIHTIIANSGMTIQLSSCQDVVSGELTKYDGGVLDRGSYVLEYIISGSDGVYLFGYLSSYSLSFESITINDNGEIVLRIFSK